MHRAALLIRAAVLLGTSALCSSALTAQQPVDSAPSLAALRPWLGDSILGVAPAGGWRRVERGFAVGSLTAARDHLNEAPSLPRALQGRMPGVSVSQGEGFTGSSARVWLRGPGSLFVNEPLLIIDGARTHSATGLRAFDLGQLPSRLEDLDPEMIERIDVLRGAAASAIYGPGASKGVILVTTKRAHQGPARWSAFAETGPVNETTDFPANFGTTGTSTATGAPVENCPLVAQANGTCTAVARRSWNPLENASPFRTGWTHAGGVGVIGGSGQVAYRANVNHERATGVYRRDEGSTTNASGNVALAATPRLDVRIGGAYRTEDLRHPSPDYLMLGLRGESVDDPVRRGYGSELIGGAEERGRRDEGGQRVTATVDATWRPRDWLRGTVLVGYDRLRSTRTSRIREPWFTVPGIPSTDSVTMLNRLRDTPEARTGTAELEARYHSWGLEARSGVGFQYLRDDDRGEAFAAQFDDDQSGPSFQSETFLAVRRVTKGFYARQHFGTGRVFVNGSLRVDETSEGRLETMLSPSVDLSWVAVRPADRRSFLLDELRLRAAYTRGGGGHLIPSAEQTSSFPGLGPSDETAERATEIEIGVDLSLLAQRVLAQLTVYRAINEQGLVWRVTPPSTGTPAQYLSNNAEFRMGGLELVLDARLVEVGALRWDATLNVTTHNVRTEVPGAPAMAVGSNQRIEYGDGIADYRPGSYTWSDTDGDGLIASDEVIVADDVGEGGSPFPDYEASLHTELGIGSDIRISALIDRRAGQRLLNNTASGRCSFSPNCQAQHDPATPLVDQAAAVAAQQFRTGGYIEDASFTKLREVRVSFALPRRWAGSATGARVSISGRNLYTWTDYRGLDPEIISRDRDGILAADAYFQPPLRTFTARLDLLW